MDNEDQLITIKTWEQTEPCFTPESLWGYNLANRHFIKRLNYINNMNEMTTIKQELSQLIEERKEFEAFSSKNLALTF